MDAQPVRLLLIEDNPDDAHRIKSALDDVGPSLFEVSVIDHLAAAHTHLAQNPVDAILLDLFLPDCQGLNTLQEIQASAADTATIVLTIFDDARLGIEAVNLGAQDCLIKEHLDGHRLSHAIRHSIERTRSTQIQLDNEQKFRSVIEQSVDGITLVDENGLIVEWNTAQEKITTLPRDQALARSIWDVHYDLTPDQRQTPEHHARLKQQFATFYAGGQRPLLGHTIQCANGTQRAVQTTISPIKTNKGLMASIITRDVTEQQRAQEGLEEAFLFLQYSLDALSAHVAILDETGAIVAINEAWRAFADTNKLDDPTYCLGVNYLDICDATTGSGANIAQAVAQGIRNVLAGDLPTFDLEYPCHGPKNQRWFMLRVNYFEVTGSKHALVEHQNVTERKLAEETLASERALLHTLIDHMPDRVYAKHRDGRYIFKNLADIRQLGARDAESVVDKTDYDYYPLELATRYHHDDQLVIESGEPLINREEPTINANGEARWILTTKVPLRDNQNDIIGLVGIGRDITDRKRTQAQVEKLHAKIDALYGISKQLSQTLNLTIVYRTIHTAIIEFMPCDGLYISSYTPSGQHVHWAWGWRDGHHIDTNQLNPFSLNEESQSHQGVVIRTGKTLYSPNYHTWIKTTEPPVITLSTEGDGENPALGPTDKQFCSALFVPLKLEHQVIGVVQIFSYNCDAFSIDERRFLESLAPQAATAVTNARLYQQMQHEVQERERAEQALRELNESLEQRIAERTQELKHSETRYRAVIEDQTEFICRSLPDTTITLVNDAYCRFFDVPREQLIGQSFQPKIPDADFYGWEKEYRKLSPINPLITVEHRLVDGNGKMRWVQWTNRWIEGEEGQAEIQAVGRDITRQKHAEDILRQALVREMDVSHMRSRFISMATHDLRTPLAIIQASIELMEQYGDRLSDDRKRKKFNEIHMAIAQIVSLLDNILIFGQAESDRQTIEPELLNLKDFCQNLITELKTSVGPEHRLRLMTNGHCAELWLDRRLLRYIIENLVANAIKFSPSNNDITITVKCTAEQVVLSIEDRGIGIPIDEQNHLFETFFRASNAAHLPGFGLGLTIVRQCVELHGGSITFESRVGEGTTFFVILPGIPLEVDTDENDSDS